MEQIEREWIEFLGEDRFAALSETLLDLSRWLGKGALTLSTSTRIAAAHQACWVNPACLG